MALILKRFLFPFTLLGVCDIDFKLKRLAAHAELLMKWWCIESAARFALDVYCYKNHCSPVDDMIHLEIESPWICELVHVVYWFGPHLVVPHVIFMERRDGLKQNQYKNSPSILFLSEKYFKYFVHNILWIWFFTTKNKCHSISSSWSFS